MSEEILNVLHAFIGTYTQYNEMQRQHEIELSHIRSQVRMQKHAIEQTVIDLIKSDPSLLYEEVKYMEPDLDVLLKSISVYSTSWQCIRSPTGSCVYSDHLGDDVCIFCGNPNDRS